MTISKRTNAVTFSLIALPAWFLATTAFSQVLMVGEGFMIDIEEEPEREAIYGKELSHSHPDWFYTAIIDLTIGSNRATSPSRVGEDGDYERGRIAGYVTGPLSNGYKLTAAADTGEEALDDLFSDLGAKTSKRMLERMNDPDRFYPVYGDDSTFEQTAPTLGKVYVRVENDRNHVMWGNFQPELTGTEYLRNERTLYGAQGLYQSVAEEGETPDFRAEVYAASPDTLARRDVFLGSGGSSYFLGEQDISVGSETLQIEIRDPASGAVISRETLVYGQDYQINYAQGLILLNAPLSSSAGSSNIASQGNGSDEAYLVATYEFEPSGGDVDAYSYGGRVEWAATEQVRVGVSAQSEDSGSEDHIAFGLDAEYRTSDKTYIRAEYARTEGVSSGFTLSTDGGQFVDETAGLDAEGRAIRIEGGADLAELGYGVGSAEFFIEDRSAGFSTLTTQATHDETLWGINVETGSEDARHFRLYTKGFDRADGNRSAELGAEVGFALNPRMRLEFGISTLDKATPDDVDETGSRTTAGARIEYAVAEGRDVYGYASGTLSRSGGLDTENRAGVGMSASLSEQTDVSAELSSGTGGPGALLRLDYQSDGGDSYYFGYTLDPDRSLGTVDLAGKDRGRFVMGTSRKLNEQVNLFAENTYDMFGEHQALTGAYGFSYSSGPIETASVALELGQIRDDANGDFDRFALSFGGAYKDDSGFALRGSVEVRRERGVESGSERDSNTLLFRLSASQKIAEDTRILGKLDTVITDAVGQSVPDSEYIEATVGIAHRPAISDKFNVLGKYTYHFDKTGQTVNGTSETNPAQDTHVLSYDVEYALSPELTLGGKVAARFSQADYGSGWQQNNAGLLVLNARYALDSKWDMLGEVRRLNNYSIDTSETGALVAVYRHIGANAQIGVGYNFARFSDDLTDLVYDDDGGFLNIVAKF